MIGQTISHYKILEEIGAGGMGDVYMAEDTKLGRNVVLKFLPAELSRDAHANRRFMHEARAASALDHPNICTIHEIDKTSDGRLFICMNHCEGESLRDVLARGPTPMNEAVKITVKVAEGLAAAHEAGVVHRDIKPGNIIATEDRGVKIIDFGLAKLAGATRVTRSGMTVGTIAYKSPEQTRAEDVDGRADIWSLGLVLFEMLTGRCAFGADFDQATVYSILNEKHPRVTDLRPDVPVELEQIVDKCLEKNPADRYQTATELADALDRLADQFGWSRASRDSHAPFWSKRRSRRIAAAITTVVAIAFAAVVFPGWEAISRLVTGGGVPKEQHLAVLRFVGVGADDSFDAFCDGLVETLTSKLTQLGQFQGALWVVPASELRRRDIKSVGEAREAFGVSLAVTGSVQRVGAGFRLTVNLVDTKTERQLESDVIDDPMTDASVLQDEIVVKLANMLNVELLPETREVITAGGTKVAGAYELYLEGRGYLQRRERAEDLDRVITLFDRAVERDSLFALAYAGLGEAYWRKYAEHKDAAFVALAKTNCTRAIEINDLLSPVHITLGIINGGTGHYNEAIGNFQKALELDPASYDAYVELAIVYKKLDWVEEAEETYLKATELRPDYWLAYQELGVFYYGLGRLEEAAEMTLKVIEIVPNRISAYNNLLGMYFVMGDKDRTIEMFERLINIEPSADAYSNMAAIYIYWGRSEEAIPLAKAATELEGRVPMLWGNLGDAYRYTPGYEQQAPESYRQAVALCQEQLSVNPRDAILRAEMACYNAKLGEHAKAVADIEMACAEAHGELQIMVASIVVYELAGRREDALRAVEEIVDAGAWTEQISSDPELVDLRRDGRYQELVSTPSGTSDQ